jgi:hypothetical protein
MLADGVGQVSISVAGAGAAAERDLLLGTKKPAQGGLVKVALTR